ncbi:MAG TPA: hypothetical protein DCR40_19130 [Prolixibacteraceae bacterium]|nr:hypothetical protein [Prolixibacteraceae bacterium]
MAELIKPLFQYKSKFKPDPFGLCTTLLTGKDFKIKKGKLELPFTGNRVDVVISGSTQYQSRTDFDSERKRKTSGQ